MKVWKPKTSHAATKDGDWGPLMREVADCRSTDAVDAWWADFLLHRHRHHPEAWSLALRDLCVARLGEIEIEAASRELDAAFSATVGAPL